MAFALQIRLVGGDPIFGEEPVESGAADAELARGAKLVAVIEFEDELNVAANRCIEGSVLAEPAGGFGLLFRRGRSGCDHYFAMMGRQREIAGANDAGSGIEDGGFQGRGKFPDISWPIVL